MNGMRIKQNRIHRIGIRVICLLGFVLCSVLPLHALDKLGAGGAGRARNLHVDKVLYFKGDTLTFTASKLKAGETYRLIWCDSFCRIIRETEFKAEAATHKGTMTVNFPTAIINYLIVETVPGNAKAKPRQIGTCRFGVRPKEWWGEYEVMKYWRISSDYHYNMDAGIFGGGCYCSDNLSLNNMRRYIGELVGGLFLHRRFIKPYSAPYERTRDRKYLIRKPCTNNPDDVKNNFDIGRVKGIKGSRINCPLGVDVRDELGYTAMGNPFDFCFCEHCIKRFREWLQTRYKSVKELNKQWDTHFKTWDEVMPDTIDDAKMKHTPYLKGKLVPGVGRFELTAEQFCDPGSENFSALWDRIQFVDEHWADFLAMYYKIIKEQIPETYAGFVGGQAPLAWSGWNWPLLLKEMTYCEAYDWGGSRDVIRSFARPDLRSVRTNFGSTDKSKYVLWRFFLRGDDGVILWSYGRAMRNFFHELHDGLGKVMVPSVIQNDPVAIYYSQPSIRVHWMLDSEVDASTWPRRYSSYESSHSCLLKNRLSWMKVFEDSGLLYKFVDDERLLDGALEKQGFKLLVLNKTCAMSEDEVKAIRKWVKKGGVCVADNMTACFDEHGKRLKKGQLDDAFGIERENYIVAEVNGSFCPKQSHIMKARNKEWLKKAKSPVTFNKGAKYADLFKDAGIDELRIVEPGIKVRRGAAALADAGGAPAMIVNPYGKGKFIYTNISWMDYQQKRLNDKREIGPNLRALTRNLLDMAGVKKQITVLDPTTGKDRHVVQRFMYKRKGMDLFSIVVNAKITQDQLGATKISGLDSSANLSVRVNVPWKRHIYDCRRGTYLGEVDEFDYEMIPVEGYVFAALPYKVKGFNVELGESYPWHFKAALDTDGSAMEHVVHVEVFDPRGVCRENYCQNLNAPGGVAQGEIPLCMNDPQGTWTAVFRDCVTGFEVIRTIEKKSVDPRYTTIVTRDSYKNTGVILDVRKDAFRITDTASGKKRAEFRIAIERVDKSFADGDLSFAANGWSVPFPTMPIRGLDHLSEHTRIFTVHRDFDRIKDAPEICPLVVGMDLKGKKAEKLAYTFSLLPLFTRKAPELDGELSEAAWKKARDLTEFLVKGKPAQQKSKAAFLLSEDALWFRIENQLEKNRKPIARCTRRDNNGVLKTDDYVCLDITPKSGTGKTYRLALNSIGKQFDSFGGNASCNFKWYRRVKSEPGRWQAELRIPLSVFKAYYKPGDETTWSLVLKVGRKRGKKGKTAETATMLGDIILGYK